MKYENLKYSDDILPVIFRKDTRESHMSPMLMHWHKAVELLLILEGEAVIQSNDETAVARKGDVVCVHSGHLHGYTPLGESCTYYCLILPPEVIGSKQLYEAPLPLICNR